ncbi:MAG: hypothetical protein C6Y20_07450 [Tagaea sp. CACIAM 22H2]|nr:hypothetical protein [Tagaea sp. CACIAM 22H2]
MSWSGATAIPASSRWGCSDSLRAMRSHHDMGGIEPFASQPIDRAEHELSEFDKRVDALVNLLSHPSRALMRVDEMRNSIEAMPPEEYDRALYYEKWIHAVAEIMVAKDVIGEEELVLKLADLKEEDGEEA